jgi:hypothetical protein
LWNYENHKRDPRREQWFGVPGDSSIRECLSKELFQQHPDWFALKRDGTRERMFVFER